MLATTSSTRTTRTRGAIAGCLALIIHLCLVFGINNGSVTKPLKTPSAAPLVIELGRLSSATEPTTPSTENPVPETTSASPTVERQPSTKSSVGNSPLPPEPSPSPVPVPEKPVTPTMAKIQPTGKTSDHQQPAQPATDQSLTKPPPTGSSFAAPVMESSPTRAPQTGAESTAQQDDRASWQNRLLAHLQRHKRYPSIARQRRQQGTATIRFSIDRNGSVMTSDLVHSSGYVLLDRSAMAMINRAQPLPRPPATVTDDELSLTLPVQFSLR